jgi:hypothetical protein
VTIRRESLQVTTGGKRNGKLTMNRLKTAFAICLCVPHFSICAEETKPAEAYLFSYFINNGEDGLHLAWSDDGLKWRELGESRSWLKPAVGNSKLMRDPCVVAGPDGTWHMVWTDSWFGQTIGYASTKDFIHWSEQKSIPVMTDKPGTRNCWAPELFYDAPRKQFRIFWASTIDGAFPETNMDGKNDLNHRIYSTTTTDFQTFTPASVWFDPGHNVIDSTLLADGNRVLMIYKDETRIPKPRKNLLLAEAKDPAGPFTPLPDPVSVPGTWLEGPSALKVGNLVIVYADAYRKHHYVARATTNFKTWKDVSARLSMPKGIRHGTAFSVPRHILDRLLAEASKP